MQIASRAFADGSTMPRRFTRDGDNVSPPLEWSGEPSGTKSFIVVMEDPDAPSGTFLHWAVYDLTPDRHALDEADATEHEGVNDFGHRGYDGPEPPRGHGLHHYHIRVAALDVDHLPVKSTAKVMEVWAAASRHVLDQAEIVGTYRRG